MAAEQRLLELIEERLVGHGGDLGGWTQLDASQLHVFSGRVTLRAMIHAQEDDDTQPAERDDGYVHAHVFASLHECEDEVLDACVCGMGDDRESALAEIATTWVAAIAGPIRSLLDNAPVCTTIQAGVAGGDIEKGFSEYDFGLPGTRCFVGPWTARGFDDGLEVPDIGLAPWFRYAAEAAAPRRVHLVKAVVQCREGSWHRSLEIDGHEAVFDDPNWTPGTEAPASFGYLTRYAVFEFPLNDQRLAQREKLEGAIRFFAHGLVGCDNTDMLLQKMHAKGFGKALVHEVESISTLAFGRHFFAPLGANYSPIAIRARGDGTIEEDVDLIQLPAYTRALAMSRALAEELGDDFSDVAFYSAESHLLMQVLEQQGESADLSTFALQPVVIPDHDTSTETMDRALKILHAKMDSARPKKPWWKFW